MILDATILTTKENSDGTFTVTAHRRCLDTQIIEIVRTTVRSASEVPQARQRVFEACPMPEVNQ